MPFFIPALIAAAVSVVASGALRTQSARKRLIKATEQYESILIRLKPLKAQFDKAVGDIGSTSFRGMDSLARAQRMLNPLQVVASTLLPRQELQAQMVLNVAKRADELSLAFTSAVGIGTGAALAAGAWTVLATFGTASTGTAIATLHGAALTHATLAAFGGGALAAGGGGMAVGVATLFSLVIIPATAIIGWQTHSRANELIADAEKLEAANEANSQTLATIGEDLPILNAFSKYISRETDTFDLVVRSTYWQLHPMGKISVYWRRLRARFWGTYYKTEDMPHIEYLSGAVDKFVSLFSADKLRTRHF